MRVCGVLLAEDNYDDVKIVKRAVSKNKDRFQLEIVEDGQEALGFLRKQFQWAGVWTPDLMLLNVNMPKIQGLDVLDVMKADPVLSIIPVAIWSIGEMSEKIRRAIEAGC